MPWKFNCRATPVSRLSVVDGSVLAVEAAMVAEVVAAAVTGMLGSGMSRAAPPSSTSAWLRMLLPALSPENASGKCRVAGENDGVVWD